MEKITMVILDNNYPNEKNKYGDVFVHSRLKYYQETINIRVVGWNKKISDYSFTYEGIHVDMVNTEKKLIERISFYKPDILGFHFVEGWMYRKIIKPFNGPSIIWIHGGEALGWYRRLFMLNFSNLIRFLRYVARNTVQMIQMHQIINYSNQTSKVNLIFVSKWMKNITSADTLSTVRNEIYIPNPIDPNLFKYQEKTPDHRKKVLLIRSFESKKYANDIAIEAILHLSKSPAFKELSFSIYGVGRFFKPLTDKIKHFENVQLHNYLLENKDIPNIHRQHGIFLCPTRQDAQGVSMCEAMSSGLVPISSFNTAIPEFLVHESTGYMTKSSKEITETIVHLYSKPDLFLKISRQASVSIRKISSTDSVVSRELELINAAVEKAGG